MISFMPKSEDAEQIHTLLGVYFNGLYHSDTARLREAFHPSAIYAAVMDGALKNLTMDQYWPIVDARPSPASQLLVRRDKILIIDVIGPTTALAKVECTIGRHFYIDLLSMIKLNERWWIIAKVFQAVEVVETPLTQAVAG
jgi:hypothetical protein